MANYKGVSTDEAEKLVADLQRGLTPHLIEVAPAEGATINLPAINRTIIVNLSPAANLSAVTLVLPSEESSIVGQRVYIASSRQISSVTVTGATTVNNPSVMFSPGDSYAYFKNKPNTWSRTIG